MHQHFFHICFTFKAIQLIVQKHQTLTQFCESLYMHEKTNVRFTRPQLNTSATYCCLRDSPWLKIRLSASWSGRNLGKEFSYGQTVVLLSYIRVSSTTIPPSLFP